MSSDDMVVLAFMTCPLAGSGAACADQPGCGASLDMADDQESPSRRVADRDETTLVLGRRSRSLAIPAVSGVITHSVVALHRSIYLTIPRFDNVQRASITASPISRMGTSVEDDCRESSRTPRHAPAPRPSVPERGGAARLGS